MGPAWNRKAGAHRGTANFYEEDNIVTRKDFELIRDVVRTIKDERTRHETATTFAVLLSKLDRLREEAASLGNFEA